MGIYNKYKLKSALEKPMFSICDREFLRHSLPVGAFTVGIPINFFAEVLTITCKEKVVFMDRILLALVIVKDVFLEPSL